LQRSLADLEGAAVRELIELKNLCGVMPSRPLTPIVFAWQRLSIGVSLHMARGAAEKEGVWCNATMKRRFSPQVPGNRWGAKEGRADGWICTSMGLFTKQVPCLSSHAGVGKSRSARI
jgi:hypothetical protein